MRGRTPVFHQKALPSEVHVRKRTRSFAMKRCNTCGEQFENQFSFCPIDGQSLIEPANTAGFEYRPTLIGDRFLAQRLAAELRFLASRFRRAWPAFKADPLGFTKDQFTQLKKTVRRTIARPHVVPSSLAAAGIVICVVLTVLVLEKKSRTIAYRDQADELVPTMTIDFRNDANDKSKPGIGAGQNGRAGFERGRGEGSSRVPARAQGGGGGGTNNPLPPSQGRPPVPSVIPAPIPTTYARLPPAALPDAGLNIDPVLFKNLPFPNYGDPRSKSTAPSNGPGQGGGVGTGNGPGIGEGENNGFGPGRKGNMGGNDNSTGCCGKGGSKGANPGLDIDRIYRAPEVTTHARVLSKPEPQYTEEARRAQITGTVVLSVVFSRDGQVTNIRAVQTLCCGLTEKAIAAARQIQFVPATINGQPVPMYMQLHYNFNLY